MPSGRSRIQKHEGQVCIHTYKKLDVLGSPGSPRSPSTTKLGMIIVDLEHVLAPWKCFAIQCIVFPLEGAENLGEPGPLGLIPQNFNS